MRRRRNRRRPLLRTHCQPAHLGERTGRVVLKAEKALQMEKVEKVGVVGGGPSAARLSCSGWVGAAHAPCRASHGVPWQAGPPLCLPLSCHSDCRGLMSQYLSLFDAAGHLSSLRDAEFIAMLQLMGRTGAVSCPAWVSETLSWLVGTCCSTMLQLMSLLERRGCAPCLSQLRARCAATARSLQWCHCMLTTHGSL